MFPPWRHSFLRSEVVLLALLLCPRTGQCSRASLFELSEHVQELNPSTFTAVAESNAAWVIDFYSPACPHCTRFAPTWEQVGTALRDSSVRVGAVNCVKHHDLCRSLKVGGYPSLLAVNTPRAPGGTAAEPSVTRIPGGSKSLQTVMTHVRDIFPGSVGGTPGALEVEVGKPRAAGGEGSAGGGNCLLRLEDATVSVRWALRNDVFTVGEELSEEWMGATLSFLDMLGTTFPGKLNRASFRNLASELRRDAGLNNRTRWDKRISKLHIGNFAPAEDSNWPAANIEKGTEANVVHFTSGLWSLFHILSVSSAPMRQQPYEIMEGIHSFVEYFFRCKECRSHFLQMYDACENHRCNIPSTSNTRGGRAPEGEAALALWVWRMHNAVNARLAEEAAEEGDQSEEGQASKSLWPSADVCKDCWSGFPHEDQPPWSETEVLKFLSATYSCPYAIDEGPDIPGNSWAVTCVLVCAVLSVVMWARRWVEMRGVGLSKKRVDILPTA